MIPESNVPVHTCMSAGSPYRIVDFIVEPVHEEKWYFILIANLMPVRSIYGGGKHNLNIFMKLR